MITGLLDIPNWRSAHKAPVPRGGGLAIVATYLAGVGAFSAAGLIEPSVAIATVGAGLLVGTVGYIDDHRHVSAKWRLLFHFIAAAWVLVWLGGLPPLGLGGMPLVSGWPGQILAAVYLVWMLNLYNFMDGIDGIAGLEAVTVGFGAVTLHLLDDPAQSASLLPGLLAFTTLGFLIWNWPPARIFMGDVGSGFLGLVLGLMSVYDARLGQDWFWGWLILLAVFVVDATFTLLRRAVRGEKVFEAHKSHAYQAAAQKLGAHRPVTVAIGAINLFFLLPVAYLVISGHMNAALGLFIAYMPLVAIALFFNAGKG